jgi:hypothetical protein
MKTTQTLQYPFSFLTSSWSFRMIACAIAASLLSFAGVCAANTSFDTGATGWQISLNGGASYNAPDYFSTRTLPDGSTVTGIAGGNLSNVTDRYYRYDFTLTELTLSATTQFVTNDLFQLLVNGNSVDLTLVVNGGTSNTNDQSPVTGLPIPGSYFQLGMNEIIFKTHSFTGGAAGDPFLAARVDITAVAVPEPSTWMMILLGSCGLLAVQRFRSRSVRV